MLNPSEVNYGEIVGSMFEAEFAAMKKELREELEKKHPEAKKKEQIMAFLKAVEGFNTPKQIEKLVTEKFGCKFSDLSEYRKQVYSAVVLLSQKIKPEHVARQMGMKLLTIQKWHSVYISEGFTGVKFRLNEFGRGRRRSA